eukprot:CCRYP_011284-RA/>CCRYP_011284-RA protein AED:0.09 eAED:0.09 QI:6/0.5/0.66/1/0.5/0.33/3/343/458
MTQPSNVNKGDDPDNSHVNHDAEAELLSTSTEITFRLGERRTTFDRPMPTLEHSSTTSGVIEHGVDAGAADQSSRDLAAEEEANVVNHTNEPQSKRAKIEQPHKKDTGMDYSTKTITTNLSSMDSRASKEEMMDSLLFDWMEPRCFLEKLALQIFHHHVPPLSSNFYYDPSTSGAEWWVQLRPSPPGTGRYSMLLPNNDPDDITKSGMSFHWDKDEDLRLLCRGSVHIHPHLSSVTYLTDLGAPTMVLSRRVEGMTGGIIDEDDEGTTGFISWPKQGKHLSFDGRLLHAAPSDLMEDGLFEKQCQFKVIEGMSDKEKKIMERRHRRTTFLVNIWLNYKPFNVNPFPETMISSMSKVDLFGDFELFGRNEDDKGDTNDTQLAIRIKVSLTKTGATEISDEGQKMVEVVEKTWPIDSCNDNVQIKVPIPMGVIREQSLDGLNVLLSWQANMIQLSSQKGN